MSKYSVILLRPNDLSERQKFKEFRHQDIIDIFSLFTFFMGIGAVVEIARFLISEESANEFVRTLCYATTAALTLFLSKRFRILQIEIILASYLLLEVISLVYWKVRKTQTEPDADYEIEGKRFNFFALLNLKYPINFPNLIHKEHH